MDYDLDRLGAMEFEHMVQALAIAELGISVSTFGAGADGGREATFDAGPSNHGANDFGSWRGYGIVQAKSMRFPREPAANATALVAAIEQELNRFLPRDVKDAEAPAPPRNYIIATNARLSATPGGGIDRVSDTLRLHAVGLAGYAIWHYEHLCRLLDKHVGVRKAFAGFVTPGDVLTQLAEVLDGSASRVGSVLKIHAASQLSAKEALKLETGEISEANKVRLSEVAIDLPAVTTSGNDLMVVDYLLKAGDKSLRNSHRGEAPYGFVVLGGPGQGKSTVGQILAQSYRIGLLENSTSPLTPQVDAAIRATKECLAELQLDVPRNRRWPVVVELAAFADALAENSLLTVVEYIATQLRSQGAAVQAGAVSSWLSTWPWLLVLDGLDEVPARTSRDAVIAALNDLIIESRLDNWDVMVVCTTRPQGYSDEFSELNARQLELRYLSSAEGAAYGRRIIRAKYRDDPETARKVLRDLEAALQQPHTTRLMRTPLQVSIMEFLLEELASVPDTRHELFDGYYRAIYARESRKAGWLGQLLRTHSEQVDWVHEQIGFGLQRNAELSGEAEASLPDDAVVDLFRKRLSEQEFDQKDIDRLSADLDRAVKQRLVLLVARRGSNLSFEVRSLQEYMAARAITTGPAARVYERLARLAPSAYWRNTCLLAYGRLYTTREFERDALLERIRRLDNDSTVGSFVGYGSRLAIDLLDDDFGIAVPAHRRSLLTLAMSQIGRWPGPELKRLSGIARSAINGRDERTAEIVRDNLYNASHSGGRDRLGALAVVHDWERESKISGQVAKKLLDPFQTGTRLDRRRDASGPVVSASRVLQSTVRAARFSPEEALQWSALEEALLDDITTFASATDSESIQASRRDLDWIISDAARRLLQSREVQDLVIRVCNQSRGNQAAAVILLRRALVTVDELVPRGLDEDLADVGQEIARGWNS
ncbi:NACHT domain-containing protein [Microbacterium sp. Leaf288]|uniref:NACHT domain-containing protein n=1 Tax=Microbacterium sp. Leaf288 TaxID=1736323 RepID=UPI0012FAF9C0|nr:hypothetical protein [Microbacterium sp. Leaf288]